MGKAIFIIGGVAVVGGVAYYFWKKKQDEAAVAASYASGDSTQSVTPSGLPASPSSASVSSGNALAPVKQTMWKDAEGNVFELTTDDNKYGYLLKTNGGGSARAVDVALQNGLIVIKNKTGEVWTFKNKNWSRLSGLGNPFALNGLRGLGNPYALSGLGSAFALS